MDRPARDVLGAGGGVVGFDGGATVGTTDSECVAQVMMFWRPFLQPVPGSPVWLHLVAAEQEANASCGCAPAVEYSADGGRELVALR